MNIKLNAMLTTQGLNFESEKGFPKLFQPDGMPVKLFINSKTSFEIAIENESVLMTNNDVMHEFGFFLSAQQLSEHEQKIRQVAKFLRCDSTKVECAPKRRFADNSGASRLARAVLADHPHCNGSEFKSLAFDLYIGMGLTKTDFHEAVSNYA